MTDGINFHENLEKDLQKLAVEISEQKTRTEAVGLPEREVVKRSIQSFANQTPSDSSVANPVSDDQNSPLPDYLAKNGADPAVKLEVEELVDMVFHKDISRAIKEAKKRSPFIEDAFHDALTDKLLPELRKRGLI